MFGAMGYKVVISLGKVYIVILKRKENKGVKKNNCLLGNKQLRVFQLEITKKKKDFFF